MHACLLSCVPHTHLHQVAKPAMDVVADAQVPVSSPRSSTPSSVPAGRQRPCQARRRAAAIVARYELRRDQPQLRLPLRQARRPSSGAHLRML